MEEEFNALIESIPGTFKEKEKYFKKAYKDAEDEISKSFYDFVLMNLRENNFYKIFDKEFTDEDINNIDTILDSDPITESIKYEGMVKKLIDKMDKVLNNIKYEVFSGNYFEYLIITELNNSFPVKSVIPIDTLYLYYAFLLTRLKKFDEAIKYYKKSIKYNKVGYIAWQELMNVYKETNKYNELYNTIIDSFKYVYDIDDLLNNYFMLMDYSIKENNEELMLAIYNNVYKYKKNMSFKLPKLSLDMDSDGILIQNNIPLGISKDVVDVVEFYANVKEDVLTKETKKEFKKYYKKYKKLYL